MRSNPATGFSRRLFTSFVLAAFSLILTSTTAWSTTIASQGNPAPNFPTGLSVASDEALEVSWTSTDAYQNVSVSVSLGQITALPSSGIAYLTTQIGTGATVAKEIASTDFIFPNPTGGTAKLFNGLYLNAGTYYLVLYSTAPVGGGWLFSGDPSAQFSAPGVTIGNSGYFYFPGVSVFGNFPYAPSVPFISTYPNEKFVFSVDGDPVSQAAVPEPSSVGLVLLAVMSGWFPKLLSRLRPRGN